MTEPNKQYTLLKLVFRLLPVLGLALIVGGFAWAVDHAQLDRWADITIGLGVLLFLTLFVKAEVANIKFYLNVVIYSALVAGICVVVYLFANQYTQKVDLTKQKLYSLSEASTKYLKHLNKPVQITIFFESTDPFQEIMDLYKGTTDKVKWRVINARKEPLVAKDYGDTVRNGDMFVEPLTSDKATTAGAKVNRKKISVAELSQNYENTITNAIIEVTRGEKLKLYFLGGHGEVAFNRPQPQGPQRNPDENEGPSLAAFKKFLNQRAMDTVQLDLTQTGFVPKDASMVIEAGPKSDLAPAEVSALDEYLGKGGKLLVLLDVPQTNFGQSLTNLQGLLGRYGVDAPDKVILDLYARQVTGSPVQPLAAWFNPEHPITRTLGSRSSRFILSLTRPVLKGQNVPQGMEVNDLVRSSEESWSESLATIIANSTVRPPEKSEMKAQPIGVAVAKSAPRPQMPGQPAPPAQKGGMRLVVFGTSDLIQDSFLANNQLAIEMMLNTVNWLSEQEDMIAVPPRQVEGTPIVLDAAQLRLIFVLAVVLIPAVLFFGGTSYSLLRRRR